MSSYIVDREYVTDTTALIMGDEAHHAVKVARRRVGERVHLIDGLGTGYEAEIVSIGGMIVSCEIVCELPGWGEPTIDVTLAVAPTKGGRFDTVVEKAVELGVGAVLPLETANSVVRDPSSGKLSRWRSLARSATKQCRRSRVPEILETVDMAALAGSIGEYDHAFVAWVQEGSGSLADCGRLAGKALIVIGPEGGFDAEEVALLVESGAKSITLGPRRLRTETAALAALTLVLDRAGETSRPMQE